MIEVSLYSIPAGDFNARVGKCLARNRFDKEALGTGINEFVKSFLRENFDKISEKAGMADLESVLGGNDVFTRRDLSCVNYYLGQLGYKFMVINVTDDEENPVGVPSGEVIEWNVIDHNFVQFDYPTATKIMPGSGAEITKTLESIIDRQDLFNSDKFNGMKNPLKPIISNLKNIQGVTGAVNPTLTAKIYEILDNLGIEIFCATSED